MEKTKLLAGTGMGGEVSSKCFSKKNQVHVTIDEKTSDALNLSRKFAKEGFQAVTYGNFALRRFWKSLQKCEYMCGWCLLSKIALKVVGPKEPNSMR